MIIEEYYIIKRRDKYLVKYNLNPSGYRFTWSFNKTEAKLFNTIEEYAKRFADLTRGKVVVYLPSK